LGEREEIMKTAHPISVNERAAKLVARMVADAAELRIAVTRGELGEMLIDAGGNIVGSIAAGMAAAALGLGLALL
jgi:methenyltetrahydromethanopterin cyclohydrolase